MGIDYFAIGDRIRGFREALHWTQAKLGEIAKVEPSNISHIERGATKVSFPTLLQIANALNVCMDDLVYDSIDHNLHVSVKMMDDVLSDCSDLEVMAIVSIANATKQTFRKVIEKKTQ